MKWKMKNNLDEMQEIKLRGIERNGCWFAFWALLAAMMIQLVLGAEPKQMAGEEEDRTDGTSHHPREQIEPERGLIADSHHKGHLARLTVGEAVAEIVHQQQGINHHYDSPLPRLSHSTYGCWRHFPYQHKHVDEG